MSRPIRCFLLWLFPTHLFIIKHLSQSRETSCDGDVLLCVCSFVRLSPGTRTCRALAWLVQQRNSAGGRNIGPVTSVPNILMMAGAYRVGYSCGIDLLQLNVIVLCYFVHVIKPCKKYAPYGFQGDVTAIVRCHFFILISDVSANKLTR